MCDLSSERSSTASFFLIAILLCSLSSPAQRAQLEGRFYPEKDSYMVGEPALFNVEIKNTGTEVVHLHAKNPAGCLDTYEFSVSGSGSPACSAKWDAECGDKLLSLKSEESQHGQWPLNFWFQFDRRPVRSQCYPSYPHHDERKRL
jgi:hypothetical protein